MVTGILREKYTGKTILIRVDSDDTLRSNEETNKLQEKIIMDHYKIIMDHGFS